MDINETPMMTVGAVLFDKAKRAARIERSKKDPGPRRGKNPCAKSRTKEDPYEIWANNAGWTWRVLKKWQVDDDKPFARWFCFVTSPHVPGGEYGDTYVKDIKANARKVGA